MLKSVQQLPTEKYDAMYLEVQRLQSFQNWPYGENAVCSASKMAEAGFFHCPTEKEPDLVQCYVCFKELDGWEASDEPWSEHYSHSKVCLFAKTKKPQKDLTVSEIFQLEAERKNNKMKRLFAQQLQNFRTSRDDIEELFCDVEQQMTASKKKK